VRYYTRSVAQNEELGLHADAARQGVEDGDGSAAAGGVGGAGGDAAGGAGSDVAAGGAGAGAGGLEDVIGDDRTLVGSTAQSSYPSRNLDGNVPGRWHKGGALIRNPTERSSATDAARASAGVVRGVDGKMSGLIFDSSASDMTKEVMRLPVDCNHCSARGECNMCVTDVPHFKEVIIMAFTCEECGWREVEVKGGGAVPLKGTVTTLHYNPADADAETDMQRDLIKGDTANIEIPELELVVEHGSLGGMYTTVEGLLEAVKSKLGESDPFVMEAADSSDAGRKSAFVSFMDKLTAVREGRVPFTLRMRDPMANTWIYSPLAPGPDPKLSHEEYTRSHGEDLELGLLDIDAPEGETDATGAVAAAPDASDAPPSSGGGTSADGAGPSGSAADAGGP